MQIVWVCMCQVVGGAPLVHQTSAPHPLGGSAASCIPDGHIYGHIINSFNLVTQNVQDMLNFHEASIFCWNINLILSMMNYVEFSHFPLYSPFNVN